MPPRRSQTIFATSWCAAALAAALAAQESPRPVHDRATPGQRGSRQEPAPVPGAEASPRQERAAVFRTRVDAIEVALQVVDGQGRPVTDLRSEEVQIFEDGRRQDLIAFTRVNVPRDVVDASSTRPRWFGPADVVSNRAVGASRIFVLILDDLHVDRRNTERVKEAARRFVERHVETGDLVSVVYTGGRPEAAQDFTRDHARVLAAIDRFIGRKLPPATIERMDQYNRLFRARGRPRFEDLRDPQDGERASHARSAMAVIEGVSSVLARVAGRRKAALVFSEGLDYDLSGLRSRGRVPGAAMGPTVLPDTAPTGGSEADAVGRLDVHSYTHDVLLSLQAALGAAARANVSLYPLDVQGGNTADSLHDLGAPVEDPALGLTAQHVNREMRDAQATLTVLAENTGGFAALTPSDYDEAFSRIVRESSDYYLVAYSPWNPAPDGAYREISVRVTRPGVRISARQGYYAPRRAVKRPFKFVASGISDETSALVMAPVPAAGLSIDAQAVAFRHDRSGKTADVFVTAHIDGRELAGASAAAGVSNTIELALIAVDSGGRLHAATGRAIDIRLDAVASDMLRNAGYRVVSRVRLGPGRYQIRQAVRERSGSRSGSIFADIEVPDFSKRPSMSGILLTSGHVATLPTSTDEETYARLPVLPSVHRAFAPDDVLAAVVEVYDAAPKGLDVVTSIRDARGVERHGQVTRVAGSELQAAGGIYHHAIQIPLKELDGDLLLTIAARPAGAATGGVSRRVAFHVARP